MKRKLEVQREIGKKNILYFKDTMYKKIFKFICKITLILILSNLFDNKLYYPLEGITRRDRVITNIKLQDILFYVLMWANN